MYQFFKMAEDGRIIVRLSPTRENIDIATVGFINS